MTFDPKRLARFAHTEMGMLLDTQQLKDLPQFWDADLCATGVILRDALERNGLFQSDVRSDEPRASGQTAARLWQAQARRGGTFSAFHVRAP